VLKHGGKDGHQAWMVKALVKGCRDIIWQHQNVFRGVVKPDIVDPCKAVPEGRAVGDGRFSSRHVGVSGFGIWQFGVLSLEESRVLVLSTQI